MTGMNVRRVDMQRRFVKPPTLPARSKVTFGKLDHPIHLAMLTTELPKNLTGGLGAIVGWSSEEFSKGTGLKRPMDVSVIAPFTAEYKDDAEKTVFDTGVHFPYPIPDGKGTTVDVKVYEAKKPSGVTEVLLRADDVFMPDDKPGSPAQRLWNWLKGIEDKKQRPAGYASAYKIDSKVATNYIFSAMAARALPLLDGTITQAGANNHLVKHNHPVDLVVVNDWLTGAAAPEIKAVYADLKQQGKAKHSPAQVFMVHNHFNNPIFRNQAVGTLGLVDPFSPKYQQAIGQYVAPMRGQTVYNPWALAARLSDGIIVNNNYWWEMKNTNLLKKQSPLGYTFPTDEAQMVNAVAQKENLGLLQDMYHAMPPTENPFTVPYLAENGYVQLKAPDKVDDVAAWKKNIRTFKATNKQALQKDLGLKVDPEAPVFLYANRYDFYQKGVYFVSSALKPFLQANKKAQVILYGMGPDTGLTKRLLSDPDLKRFAQEKRLVLINQRNGRDKMIQAFAGSDFLLMTSYYEPYGISQLEAMTFASIPMAVPVGGLRTTLSDPKWNGKGADMGRPKEGVWKYGQSAIFLKPMNWAGHRDAVMKMQGALETYDEKVAAAAADASKPKPPPMTQPVEDFAKLKPIEKAVLAEGQQAMLDAYKRAAAMSTDERTAIAANNLKILKERHQWEQIIPRYEQIFERAVERHLSLSA